MAGQWSSASAPDESPRRWRPAGVRVEGLDASASMVVRLRSKPGGTDLSVTMRYMAEPHGEGRSAWCT